MPTGFDKFRKKTLEESPIKINTPETSYEQAEEEKKSDTAAVSEQAGAIERNAERKASSRSVTTAKIIRGKNTGKKEQERELVNFMAQISPETKQKIDEMRFRLKMKNWEIVDEAVKDLYDKYFKR